MGQLISWDGGGHYSDVVVEPLRPGETVRHKHLAGLSYAPISMRLGPGMDGPLLLWVHDSLTGGAPRHNGAIVTLGLNGKVQSRLTFSDAIISEVVFPECDGASKEPDYITLKLLPETTQESAQGVGAPYPGGLPFPQHQWLPSAFRVTIPGLDCIKINKVSAITLQGVAGDTPVAAPRDAPQATWSWNCSDVTFSVAEAFANTWKAWCEQFLDAGNNGLDNVKSAVIEYLKPDGTDVSWKVNLAGLGIFSLSSSDDGLSEATARCVASMYCESAAYWAPGMRSLHAPGTSPAGPAKGAGTLASTKEVRPVSAETHEAAAQVADGAVVALGAWVYPGEARNAVNAASVKPSETFLDGSAPAEGKRILRAQVSVRNDTGDAWNGFFNTTL